MSLNFISKYFLFFIVTFFTYSCIYTTEYGGRSKILVDFKSNNLNIDIDSIKIVKGTIRSEGNLMLIDLSNLRGGTTYLFGVIVVKKVDPASVKRIKINCDNNSKYEFTALDIANWKIDSTTNEMIFIAPNICDL